MKKLFLSIFCKYLGSAMKYEYDFSNGECQKFLNKDVKFKRIINYLEKRALRGSGKHAVNLLFHVSSVEPRANDRL